MNIINDVKTKVAKNQTFFLNLLVIEILSHIFYKVSFENYLLRDFDMNKVVFYQKIDLYRTELESPFNTLLINFLNINSHDNYKIIIYLIFQVTLILICKNLSFLQEYSTLFLFGGWLVTVSWWVGFVENISVLLMILYFKNYLLGNYNRFYFYLFLLGINHFGHALFSTLIFLIIINFDKFSKIIMTISLSFISLRLYLKYIVDFQGRGRFRFIFNQNTLDDGTKFISENLKEFYWSGFMGLLVILLLLLFFSSYEDIVKYNAILIIATVGAALTTDSGRNFSIIIIPLLIHLILRFQEINFKDIIFKKVAIISIVMSNILVGVRFVHGKVWTNSPNVEMESVYNFIARMVNTIMKDIWA